MKKFFLTLGVSVGVWVVSMIFQQIFTQNVQYGFFIFAKSCEVTGYPIARCVPDYNKLQIFATYGLNILFWFWVVHLFMRWLERRKS